jgi:HK97 family phage prohead protease
METVDLYFDELKLSSDTTGEFSGTAVTFGTEIPHHVFGSDIITQGAFSRSLAAKGAAAIKMLWQHDVSEHVGRWLSLHEDREGLQVRGQLILDLAKAREAQILMKSGVISGLSIGFNVPPGGAEVDARRQVRTLKQIDLFEVSLVTFPADTRAKITEIKSERASLEQALGQIRELRRWLRGAR